jgi:hypothetical protein
VKGSVDRRKRRERERREKTECESCDVVRGRLDKKRRRNGKLVGSLVLGGFVGCCRCFPRRKTCVSIQTIQYCKKTSVFYLARQN